MIQQSKAFRILVVDDEPIACECLKRVLDMEGHAVDIARSGKEALVLFEEGKFDLVILDYEMREMKGDELVLLIKALAPTQPIAMVTSYPEELAVDLLENLDRAITKPFDARELSDSI